MLTVASELVAQENKTTTLKDFKITLEKTQDGIKMQSSEGSAWPDLSFTLKNNKSQAVDEFGMTKLGNIATLKDANLADYLITITKTKDGFIFKGIEGTSWDELSLTLSENKKQVINQNGIVNLN